MSAPIICPHCATPMSPTARFCPGCGIPRTAVRQELERASAATGIPYEQLLAQARENDAHNPRSAPPVPEPTPSAIPSGVSGKQVALIIGGLIVAVLVIALVAPNTDDDDTPARASSSTRSTSSNSNTSRVVYRVKHSSANAEMSVTYENAQGGNAQEDIAGAFWEKSFDMKRGSFAYISVQNGLDHGDVECEIIVDGKQWKHTESSGAFVIATCNGSVP